MRIIVLSVTLKFAGKAPQLHGPNVHLVKLSVNQIVLRSDCYVHRAPRVSTWTYFHGEIHTHSLGQANAGCGLQRTNNEITGQGNSDHDR